MSRSRSAIRVALGCTVLGPAFLAFNQAHAAPAAAAAPVPATVSAPVPATTLRIGVNTTGNTITFKPSEDVAAVRIQITSATGNQLYNSGWMTGFDAGLDAVTWQALDDKGNLLPSGLYLTQVDVRGTDGTTKTESGSLQLDAAPTTRSDVTPRDTTITGAGTANRIVRWLTASTVGDSIITQTNNTTINVAGTITAVAVTATNNSGNALVGNSRSGTALAGITQTGNGVLGTSTSANGMRGVTGTGIGVRGDSNGGTFGVQGNSNGAPTNGSVPVGVDGNANGGATSIGVRGTSATGIGVNGSSGSTVSSASAVLGTITSTSPGGFSAGVRGTNNGTGGLGVGVYGSQNGSGYGVYGYTPSGAGIVGSSNSGTGVNGGSTSGNGVNGNTDGTGVVYGVVGTANSTTPSGNSVGVRGINNSTNGKGYGVYGSHASTGSAVYGSAPAGQAIEGSSDTGFGVYAKSNSGNGVYGQSTSGNGVQGFSSNASGLSGSGANGVYGFSTNGYGVYGTTGSGSGVYGTSTSGGYAGYFNGKVYISGNLQVNGTLSKGGGSFRIDDPLDPANKYLSHSFVESPDMMNIYNGNATTDAKGYVTIQLPKYFGVLNRDFRYQLTTIGSFARAIVAQEVNDNRFVIRTDAPNVKVSWQVTGVRRDPWANDHRIPTQQLKTGAERGRYLYPAGYHKPASLGIDHLVDVPRTPKTGMQQVTLKHTAPSPLKAHVVAVSTVRTLTPSQSVKTAAGIAQAKG